MLSPEEFAILPWGWTAGDAEALKLIRECGFNLAGFVAPEALDAVSAAGLKAIVSEGSTHVGDAEAGLDEKEIARRVQALVDKVGKHSAVYGYYLRDEPNAAIFEGIGKWADAFKKSSPNALPYINLLPTYASASQLGTPTYEEYVETFVQKAHPKFISYDNYSLLDDGSLRDGYYQNLEIVRAVALRHDLPFWNIVLSNTHFRYAEPTPAGFRFQLYTTMAYGARGISYFTYFAPTIGNYRSAPIDQFGNKTPTWDMLRNVNLQLQHLGKTYIGLKSVNVFHNPNVPNGCLGIGTSKYLTKANGGDLLIGEFEGDGGVPYVMVVNKSLTVSIVPDIEFKEPGRIWAVNAYTGNAEGWSGERMWLAPGQGMLLFLKK